MIITVRERFASLIFKEIVIIASWAIWTHHNNKVFDGASLSCNSFKSFFLSLRAKPCVSWLANYESETGIPPNNTMRPQARYKENRRKVLSSLYIYASLYGLALFHLVKAIEAHRWVDAFKVIAHTCTLVET
jgi:hypothetical protein